MTTKQKNLTPTKIAGVYKQLDGSFLVRVSVWVGGTSRQAKKVLDAGTKPDDLKRAVLDLKAEARKPPLQAPIPSPHLPDSSQTVQQYCVSWLRLKTPEISPSTLETYAAAINNYIVPRLGWMACKDVSRDAVKAWVIWAKSLRRKCGKPYTQDTMRQWWRVLKVIFGDMALSLDLPRDPTFKVDPPSRPELDPVREQNTLDADALGRLLTACRETAPQWYAEVATMALTGARAGEVYGLKWECVDFLKKQLTIRRAVSRGHLLERTKTKVKRIVPMSPDLVPILLAHQAQQAKHREDFNAKAMAKAKESGDKPKLWPETDLVFTSVHGELRDPKSVKKIWPGLCKEAKIDQRVSPQVLRRTMNTLMLAANVDRITLRAIMGHTSEAMTQRYAGIGDAAKADAISRIRPVITPAAQDIN